MTFLEFGVHHLLFKQAQLSRYLQPFIAADTKKEVTESAAAMALSRLLPALIKNTPKPSQIILENITVTTGLCTASYLRTVSAHRVINRLQTDMYKRSAFCNIYEGMKEVTVIIEERLENRLHALVGEAPVYQHNNLTSVEIIFGYAYTDTPRMLRMCCNEQHYKTSNCSDVTLFIAEKDVGILFDALFKSFSVSRIEWLNSI